MTLQEFDKPVMTELARGFFYLVSDVWAVFTTFPLTGAVIERYRTTIRLFDLSNRYFDEMCRCTDGEAYFASGVVGCAVIESFLLLACVRDRDLVLRTRAWKGYANKQKRRGQLFIDLVFWIDLGSLILIGKELGWFSPDKAITTRFFEAFGDPEDLAEMLAEIPDVETAPFDAVTRVHELRNYLHPGKCIRDRFVLSDKAAKLSVGLVFVSMMGVLDFYRGDPDAQLDLEVPAPLRTLVGEWKTETAPPNEAAPTQR